MAKVLLTGSTRVQAKDDARLRSPYASNPVCLFKALTNSGHDVDWRPVVPGEDLSGYDCLIIGLSGIGSLGSKHMFGALWAAAQDVPKAFLVDDWKIGDVFSGLKGSNGKPGAVYKDILPRAFREQAGQTGMSELFMSVIAELNRPWKVPMVASFFDWGDRTKWLHKTFITDLITFDPTAYQDDHGVVSDKEKSRSWVLASLADHVPWLKKMGVPMESLVDDGALGPMYKSSGGWNIELYGYKKGDQMRLSEPDLMRVYETSWGVMSPKYNHAGSGWWRARYAYCAQAGSILLASPEEVAPLGGAYTWVAENPSKVEAMDDVGLAGIADDQSSLFWENSWSEQRFLQFASDLPGVLSERGREPIVDPAISRGLIAKKEEISSVFDWD